MHSFQRADSLTFQKQAGTAERILYGGWGGGGGRGGHNKQGPEMQIGGGFQGNSPPESFEILKLANATFTILDEILKK